MQGQQTSAPPPTSTGEPANKAENPRPTSRGASVAVSAISVISGYRYMRRAFSSTAKAAKMPYARRSFSEAQQAYAATRKTPEFVDADGLTDDIIRKSLIGHTIILALTGPVFLISLYYAVFSWGIFIRHGQWLPHGNYGLVSGTLFAIYAMSRFFVSWRSAKFFRAVSNERQVAAHKETSL